MIYFLQLVGYYLFYRLCSGRKEMLPPESLAFIENYMDLEDDDDYKTCFGRRRSGSIISEKGDSSI